MVGHAGNAMSSLVKKVVPMLRAPATAVLKAAVEVPLPISSLALLRCDLAARRRRETCRTSST